MLRAKDGQFEKGLGTLRDAPNAYKESMRRPESQVASVANAIADLATLVDDYNSNFIHMTAENSKLRTQLIPWKKRLSRHYQLRPISWQRSVI